MKNLWALQKQWNLATVSSWNRPIAAYWLLFQYLLLHGSVSFLDKTPCPVIHQWKINEHPVRHLRMHLSHLSKCELNKKSCWYFHLRWSKTFFNINEFLTDMALDVDPQMQHTHKKTDVYMCVCAINYEFLIDVKLLICWSKDSSNKQAKWSTLQPLSPARVQMMINIKLWRNRQRQDILTKSLSCKEYTVNIQQIVI